MTNSVDMTSEAHISYNSQGEVYVEFTAEPDAKQGYANITLPEEYRETAAAEHFYLYYINPKEKQNELIGETDEEAGLVVLPAESAKLYLITPTYYGDIYVPDAGKPLLTGFVFGAVCLCAAVLAGVCLYRRSLRRRELPQE